jgi:hypothetical protein
MLDNKKTILTCGDSFTFGSEIINPTLSAGKPEPYKLEPMIDGLVDFHPENDEYRISRIWPTHLGELSNSEVINIAKPAIGNAWIYHSTIGWILKNYIERNKPTDDLIVIVGWTSVVRKEFFFAGESNTYERTLNVNGDFKLESKDVQEFFKYYALTTDFDTQGVYDLVNYSFNLFDFCQSRNIKCYFFNALPDEHHSYQLERYHKDLNIQKYIENFKCMTTCWNRDMYTESLIKWNSIPSSFYLQKDRALNSFSNYIKSLPLEERLHGVHPSPRAHKIWAEVIYDFIFNKNTLAYNPSKKLI